MEKDKYSFFNGYKQLTLEHFENAIADLMEAMNIQTGNQFRNRMRGKIKVLDATVKKNVEEVFARYGITQNIWGGYENRREDIRPRNADRSLSDKRGS